MNCRSVLCAAALLAAATVPTTSLSAQDVLVKAKTIVVAADTVLTDGAVLLRQGKVAYVGNDIPAEARAQATVADYGDATIVPGFVLPPTTLGRDRDLVEAALPFTPDLRAVEAFDPWQEELTKLLVREVTRHVTDVHGTSDLPNPEQTRTNRRRARAESKTYLFRARVHGRSSG